MLGIEPGSKETKEIIYIYPSALVGLQSMKEINIQTWFFHSHCPLIQRVVKT